MISIMTMMLIDDEDFSGSYTELHCNSPRRWFWHQTIHQIERVFEMGEWNKWTERARNRNGEYKLAGAKTLCRKRRQTIEFC
jgi:hypothetical protein